MSKISIKNLGPIKEYINTVDDSMMILIGEQASGKSTIAKCIFFCKSIAAELKSFLINQENFADRKEKNLYLGFRKVLRIKFLEFFGTTKHMEPFEIEYMFDNGESVKIVLQKGYANITFSPNLEADCKELISHMDVFYNNQYLNPHLGEIEFSLWQSNRGEYLKKAIHEAERIFEQSYTPIFVPAGRSLLSTNAEFFHFATPNKYDALMNSFIDRIRMLQGQYSQNIEDIVEDRKKYSADYIDFSAVKKAIELARKVLKGDYISDKTGEKIFYDKEHYVKLIQASSGQQECLWIVLLIFSIILNNDCVFMVIEEPEAHLFPKAQKEIMELIMLMVNSTGSKVIVTTHSPYVLSSTNLLMYASHVGSKDSTVNQVVDSGYQLESSKVSAYLVQDHIAIDIMNREENMITMESIDGVSEDINSLLEKLIGRDF